MAEGDLQKVEDNLKCSICQVTYTDPKLLQCNHPFCQECLVKLVDSQQELGQLLLTCPTCRQLTPVPANGVAGLKPAVHISCCVEIVEELKKVLGQTNASHSPASHGITVICPDHGGIKVEMYCNTCETTICRKCIGSDGKHHSHECVDINYAFEKYKEKIKALLGPLDNQATVIKTAMQKLDKQCGEISDQRKKQEDDINIAFKGFQESLDARKTELISRLDQLSKWKLKSLEAQKSQIETTLVQLSSCGGGIKESLETGSKEEVLMMKQTVEKQVQKLTDTFQPDSLKPITEADMAFSATGDFIIPYQVPYPPESSQCRATGEGIEVAVVGETSTVILKAFNFKGEPCNEPLAIGSIECKLESEITCAISNGVVTRGREAHLHEISYQPIMKGRHKLHIKVKGQHIRGSPFSVAVKLPVEDLKVGLHLILAYFMKSL